MPTINQLVRMKRPKKIRKIKTKALDKCPQKKGVCLKVLTMNPKKPNSAVRKIARVKLSNQKIITVYLPGQGHTLQQFSVVLVRGGRVKDLPGVKYKAIRGLKDFSWKESFLRMQSRSKYGGSKIIGKR